MIPRLSDVSGPRAALGVVVAFAILLAPASALAAPNGSTQLVSRPDGLGPVPPALGGDSFTPGALSSDGRYAVFVSNADGLSPDANPRVENVFVRDRQTQTTTLVSRSDGLAGAGVNSAARNPSITVAPADSHVLVAFESAATDMVDDETGAVDNPNRVDEVWLRDVSAGTTTLVSRASGASAAPADESARNPAIAESAGGPLVALDSQATNLGGTGVFLRTVLAHVTAQVSCVHLECAVPGVSHSSKPDIRVVPSQADTRCAPPAHPFPCVFVAFVTSDNSVFAASSGDQIAFAVATAPFFPGFSATPIDDFLPISVDDNDHFGAGARRARRSAATARRLRSSAGLRISSAERRPASRRSTCDRFVASR